MICISEVKKYCKNYTEIENYDEAVKSDKPWACHHRLELMETGAVVDASKQDLIDWGTYYDRPADELIFMEKGEHTRLHNKGNTYCKGRVYSEETKRKISAAHKGLKHSEEAKRKMSAAHKGKPLSEEQKLKLSIVHLGKPKSEEAKRKMSETKSKMGWKIDPSTGKRVWYRKEI